MYLCFDKLKTIKTERNKHLQMKLACPISSDKSLFRNFLRIPVGQLLKTM